MENKKEINNGVWVVSCVLSGFGLNEGMLTNTISWTRFVNEDEARGRAVSFALESKKNFHITLITSAFIPSVSEENK